MASWLQGGPFLELSFITINHKTIESVINQIQNVDKIEQFYKGYLYDDDDPNSNLIHAVTFNVTVHTIRQRRALLFVEEIGRDSLFYSLCFFGDAEDAPEWNQPGIRSDEMHEVRNLFISLYKELKFSVGGLGIEENVKSLLETEEEWPYENFTLSNVNLNDNLSKFMVVIIDKS